MKDSFAAENFPDAQVRRDPELESAFEYLIYALARATQANDYETGSHILRVGKFCMILARELNMPEDFIRDIRLQSCLHDVGKIHIPSWILRKHDKLSETEWVLVKEHPIYGAAIIGDHPRLRMARSIALAHHERWDGSGYPCGLRETEIPMEARIMSVADEYEALRSIRYYKPALDHQAVCRIITEGDGRILPQHFSPQLLDVFKKIHPLFEETFKDHKDDPSGLDLQADFCVLRHPASN